MLARHAQRIAERRHGVARGLPHQHLGGHARRGCDGVGVEQDPIPLDEESASDELAHVVARNVDGIGGREPPTPDGGDGFIFQKVQGANGAACSHLTDCASAFCADGVCCNEACTGTCRACSAAKKGAGVDGTCGAIADGTNPDGECTAAVCSSMPGVVDKPRVCNGMGACRSDGTTSCGLFVCMSGACLTTCSAEADCLAGNYCQAGACTGAISAAK